MSFDQNKHRYRFALAALALFALPACTPEAGTGGEQITFSAAMTGARVDGGSPSDAMETSRGWQVTLTRADMLVGPIFMYSGAPRASLFEQFIGIKSAHACAAHAQFESGTTLGDLGQQYGVDLLARESTLVSERQGVAGELRSLELHLQEPGASGQLEPGNAMASSQTDATIMFEGSATKDGMTVPFVGTVTLPEEGTVQAVDSIGASGDLSSGSTVLIKVYIDQWFDEVDFAALAEQATADDKGRYTIAPGTQAYGAMTLSVRSRYAFDASIK